MTELYLLRHGSTEGNELHRYVGRRTDEPLSALGREQCHEIAPFLPHVDKVYVSPMARARETARICFPEACFEAVPGLEEFDFGVFEGRSAADMEHDEQYRSWVDSWCVDPCPEGEYRAAFTERSNEALLSVVNGALEAHEQRIVVVAHGGTIMAAMHSFCHENVPSDDYFGWSVAPCEGYAVAVRLDQEGLHFTDVKRLVTTWGILP